MTANYDPRRNIVQRPDGRPVNVARSRGQLFVCADACCCGRVEEGMPSVPRDHYHAEWERRRLRNIVHLTVGGCLGPCALANVTLLILDGRASWFQSVNSEEVVTALYDYIEAMLDADRHLAPPEPLASLLFTAATWEPRADGLAVDDRDRWQRRRKAVALTPSPSPNNGRGVPSQNPSRSSELGRDRRLSSRETPGIGTPLPLLGEGLGVRAGDPPRRNGELLFDEPWQGRAFGMAVALNEGECYPWDDFRERLIAQIADADARDEPSGYYERWLAAFEQLLTETGVISRNELDERTAEIEFGERDDVF